MEIRCTPEFETAVTRHFALADLARHDGSIFGLSSDARITLVNPAWDTFAAANGGQPVIRERWDLGASYFAAIPRVLRPFYERLLAEAPAPGAAVRPLAHQYDCPSTGLFRRFNLQVYALPGRLGYLMVNALVVERSHGLRETHLPEFNTYTDLRGLIRQCAHCRRVQFAGDPRRWDWVPAWVEESPDRTSHAICDLCLGYYYPDLGPERK